MRLFEKIAEHEELQRSLYVMGIKYDKTAADICAAFRAYGTVTHVRVLTGPGPDGRRSIGKAFVEFSDAHTAQVRAVAGGSASSVL